MIYIEIPLPNDVHDAMLEEAKKSRQTIEELAAEELEKIYG
jgi:hypothetical protein